MKVSKEVKIGLIVTIATALLIYGFNFLKGKDVFSKRNNFYGVYNEIDGLVESDMVQINGFSIGRVSDIHFLPDNSGRIVVEVVISDNALDIPSNTVMKVVSSSLLGSKSIQLLLGDSKTIAESGDTLFSDVQASLGDEVNKQVLPLKNKAEKLISSIDSILTVIQFIFNEKSQHEISKSFENISLGIQSLKRTAYRVDTLVNEQRYKLSKVSANLESITTNLKNNNEKISRVLANFSSISDTLLKANIATTIGNANLAIVETGAILEKINKGEGSLGLLLNNDSLYNNLNTASRDLDLLFQDMRENPKRYVHFSVFGGGGKEKKKDKKENIKQ